MALNHATEIPPFLYPEVVIELFDIKKEKTVYTKNLQQIIDEEDVTFSPGLISVKMEYLDEWLAWGGRILLFAKIHEKNIINSPVKIRIKGVNDKVRRDLSEASDEENIECAYVSDKFFSTMNSFMYFQSTSFCK